MIDVKIDLVPFGQEADRRNIGGIKIANNMTGTHTIGSYDVTFADGKTVLVDMHKRTDDVYTLLYLALAERELTRLGKIADEEDAHID